MRVTNTLFYNTSLSEHQNAMKKMYDINTQMASGLKIQNSFENSGVFVDTMRLNYEIATLEQTKETSSKANTFAQNTDTTMNQFETSLINFKDKLLQASNASNSTTSLNALANELTAIKNHMISVGNTSINGQFLFSGTSLLQKPLSNDGTYLGNGENLKAIIGSGVELPYNIDGNALFLGKDSDYNRIVSTNVPMYDQTKLHPNSMGGNGSSSEVYLNDQNTIRDMVGGEAVFFLSGRKGDGATFSDKIKIDAGSKISDLLESIGTSYGNTSTNKVVDVSMNAHGQIELKNLTQGNQILEMNIFGAVGRDLTAATAVNGVYNDPLLNNIDLLLTSPNIDIISFNKSNFLSTNASSQIASREDIYTPGLFRVGYPMKNPSGTPVEATSLLQSFMGSNVQEIEINGTFFGVDNTTTVDHLLIEINTQYPGVSSRIENGQILVEGTAGIFSTVLTARDTAVLPPDGTGNSVNAFSIPDGMNYTRRGFEKDGNTLLGNISQIVKSNNEFATNSTKLSEVAGAPLDDKTFTLDYTNSLGSAQKATLNFSNLAGGTTFTIGTKTFAIYGANGNPTLAKDMTYQQLNDIIAMAVSGNLPADNITVDSTIDFEEYSQALTTAKANVDVSLDYKGHISIKDKKQSESKITFSLYDNAAKEASGKGSALSFMANDSVTISNPSIDFFKDLDAMIEAVRTGNFRMDGNSSDPRNTGMQNSILQIDHILDHVTKEHTKIGAYSNALSNANDRATYLSLNVNTVRTSVIGVDVAEAYLQFNQVSTSYQAMLSTISKINSMTLLNYM